ncbi:MAG: type II secretion system F family protein [Novosphingobium sp.]
MTDLLIRLVVLLAVFASVFVLSQLLIASTWENRSKVRVVNERLRMLRDGSGRAAVMARFRKNSPKLYAHLPPFVSVPLQRFQTMLHASAVPFTSAQIALAMASLLAILFAVILFGAVGAGFYLNRGVVFLALVVATCAAVVLPLMVISFRAQRRRKRIEQQFPVALDVFVRALKSGHPVASGLDLLTQEMEDPIGSEFGLVSDEVAYGAELTEALAAMAERWDQEDIRMFVVSLSVQSETGGNLAEILENLSDVIRARASLYMKVRALSSEGRMTGWMLTVLPVFAFVGMFLTNPGFYIDVAHDPIFVIGFSSLLLLYLLGFIMIRKMVNLKV